MTERGNSPSGGSTDVRREEDEDTGQKRDRARENRREKEKKKGSRRDGMKLNGAKRRGAVTNEPVSNNHTSPVTARVQRARLPLTSAAARRDRGRCTMRREARTERERGKRGAPPTLTRRETERPRAREQCNTRRHRSVETALVSVLPEDPSLRMPPLSAHRSHGQPREEDDAHLEAAIFFVEREELVPIGTDPAVRFSRREGESLGVGKSMRMDGKIAKPSTRSDESSELMRKTSASAASPVLHGPAGISD
ncbi:hypothetical protein DBV15_00489 [Temnothorax longispinosus]|uniref:Uncharacterized protein n=1 Tax=Temnothorax longispinosus TaxID=300112 RepID=A0A4V3S7Q3_9HYME|nr:hypothetical protein DBV15_00489 [Temnothorax longispinosus]